MTMTIGVLSPGDMGGAIAALLRSNGARVLTCLEGRSERTRGLAVDAGCEICPSLEELVVESEVLISVLVPSRALEVATSVATALQATGADLLYVDANAIAPRTVQEIGEIVGLTGARVADVGIVGAPPRKPGTRFYTSGPAAAEFATLAAYGLDVRIVGDALGQASGFKMCYAALTKGLTALGVELLVAAKLMGLEDALRAEHRESMPDILSWLERQVPSMPPKAYRWVGEMEEIAQTFADLGLTPNLLLGAADMYRLVTDTPIGRETPENRDRSRDLDGVINALAAAVTDATAR
jgi:3-hydroxyisobutyrate dehydrogenase-like beta-hydroxyacid dehydrogenase